VGKEDRRGLFFLFLFGLERKENNHLGRAFEGKGFR